MNESPYWFNTSVPLLVPIVVVIGALIATRRACGLSALDIWTRWWFVGCIGFGAIVFVGITFLLIPASMAEQIGYSTANDFQREIAFTNIGWGVAAILAAYRSATTRMTGLIGYTIFLWGAAVGHIYEYVAHGDHAAGNTGGILVYDVGVPLVALLLVAAQQRRPQAAASGRDWTS